MMRLHLFVLAALLAANTVYAEPGHDREHEADAKATSADSDDAVVVERNQAVIQVNGVVCSFCAYGAEKSLSKLDCLDRAQFGDGVLVDINAHRITLALRAGEKVPIRDAYQRIKKAGYDPVTVFLRASGTLERRGETLLLRDSASGQLFSIAGGRIDGVADDAMVEIQAHLDGEKIPSLKESDPVEVVVDRLLSGSARRDG